VIRRCGGHIFVEPPHFAQMRRPQVFPARRPRSSNVHVPVARFEQFSVSHWGLSRPKSQTKIEMLISSTDS
jgi:hypothetical protein